MMTDFSPSEAVLALRLPLSLDGLTLLNDFVDRVYGTGETTMRGDGDQITIAAPKDGFGPVVRGKLPRPKRSSDEDTRITKLDTGSETMVWDMESCGGALGVLVQSQLAFLDLVGAKNYISTGLTVGDQFVQVVVQRDGKPTPHALRLEAEEREAALRTALTEAGAALRDGDPARASEVIDAAL